MFKPTNSLNNIYCLPGKKTQRAHITHAIKFITVDTHHP